MTTDEVLPVVRRIWGIKKDREGVILKIDLITVEDNLEKDSNLPSGIRVWKDEEKDLLCVRITEEAFAKRKEAEAYPSIYIT